MRKPLPTLLLLTSLLVTFLGAIFFFLAGGQVWYKTEEGFRHHGFIFTSDPPGHIYEGYGNGIVLQEPPELYQPPIQLIFHITPDVAVFTYGEALDVRGTFYKSWPRGDIYPAFTREKLLDKLLEEARAYPGLPEDVEIELHPRFVAWLKMYDAAIESEDREEETLSRRKKSQMLGQID